MEALPTLHTDRLVLQPRSFAVARALAEGGDAGLPLATGYPYAEASTALAAAAAAQISDPGDPDDGHWLLRLAASGTVVGDCGVKGGVDSEGAVEVTYGLAPSYRGQGYAGEAVGALVRWLASDPGVRRVRAEVRAGNAPSRRLLERLGFTTAHGSAGWITYERDV